jgi:DNA-binding MarR family transcriptional regulator
MSARFQVGLGTKLRHLIARLDGDVQQIYDEMAVGFRPRFYPIVQLLLEFGPQNINAIAEQVGVSQPAITQTLGEMKRLSLTRAKPGTDRRIQIIDLTAKGRTLAQRLESVWNATHRAAAKLDSELRVKIDEVIDQALAALERESFHHRIRTELKKAL